MSGLEFAALGNGEGRYIGGRGDGGGVPHGALTEDSGGVTSPALS